MLMLSTRKFPITNSDVRFGGNSFGSFVEIATETAENPAEIVGPFQDSQEFL